MLKSIKLLSLFLLLILSSCSKEDSAMESESLTDAQEEFIALLKTNYPTQIVNFNTDTALIGGPFVENQKLTLTFSSSGMLFIDTDPDKNDGDEIELPSFDIDGKEYVWKDTSSDLSYRLSLKTDNTINEVNVFKTSNNNFYASLKEVVKIDEIDIKTGLIGGSILDGELNLSKTVSTFVGKKGVVGYSDGIGEEASFTNPLGITTDGDNLYVVEQAKSTTQLNFNIRKINIETKEVTTLVTIGGVLPSTTGITNDGTYIYIASNKSVTKIKILDGTVTTLATFDEFVKGVTFYNKKLYVTKEETSTIYEMDASTGTFTKHTVIGISTRLNGITTDGNFLYVASSASDSVYKIDMTTYSAVTLGTAGLNVEAVATDGVYVYTASPSYGTLKKINIATGATTLLFNTVGYVDGPFVEGNFSQQGSFGNPTGITSDGENLYISEGMSPIPGGNKNNAIRKIE
ncbi:DNA-binding beta-propeller fold protein YncE [Wenyingzhuangia heitensis]|uniref:DNA-binding beta-propeller fold protein YncE n=1 Tax=Wenyingzhuangia heitensis TaxID=1487859 RepID=A0ABX0U9B6_9FLAO|nr:hypothetical protein [Wenyingzhuangia heitensis]NIJ44181.1 DNA-binding beta-propeller fold protein YncE [Wenyingzhuangia heitensis]